MYAVIKTGGKQYRVKAGDLLVVEKLGGEPGESVSFGEVLMLGDGAGVTVGAPTVAGAVVSGTLIETRKGDKLKVFKKIRRQGYRRTGGHRQQETVIRVTAIDGAGLSDKWDGEVDLTPRSVLNARARGLKLGPDAVVKVKAEKPAKTAKAAAKPAAPKAEKPAKAEAAPAAEAPAKAEAKPEAKAKAAPAAKAPAKAAAAPKTDAPKPAAKKPAAPKAKSTKTDGDDA